MNNKKQLLLSIGLVLILVLMIVGISYAAFKFTGLGTKPNTITTGAITMEYTESTNTISMTGALPTTDATGKVRLTAGEYFDFTIKSNIQGNANINWEIAAEDITASSSKKMDGKNIKLYLTKLNSEKEEEVMAPKVYSASTSANTKTGRPSGVMSLATGTMSTSETTNYRLRMYVDEDYNPQGDGGGLSFSVKINAYGKVKEAPTGSKIKAYMTQSAGNNPQTDFHTYYYKSKITSIITKKDNIVPSTAVESWDISEVIDMSSMFYGGGDISMDIEKINVSNFDTSKVTDMSSMFMSCSGLTSLDVSNFDTSNVTDMSNMFSGCSKLTSLDVSNFDTSKVTDMNNMFYYCSSLTSLDLSDFDTSQVKNMSSMFSECSSLTSLDVSNFDTSQVTDMSWMFDDCSSLTELDVRNFNTSQVTDMSYMFSGCSSLTSLDVSNFDTSKVTDMGYMFNFCSSLTNLDLSNFDTSKVTNMSAMFSNCSSLTNLDLRSFDTSKVTNMRWMFYGCSKLTQITVSNKWVIGSSTDVVSMFNNCGTDHVTVV